MFLVFFLYIVTRTRVRACMRACPSRPLRKKYVKESMVGGRLDFLLLYILGQKLPSNKTLRFNQTPSTTNGGLFHKTKT